ncbi:MAG TPA: DUF3999 domain-containing protein [Chromatiales bacterium]|nr:DUF3999 domain-containing protein [Chromatiales bacterium]
MKAPSLLLALMFPGAVMAAPPQANDFAWGATIQMPSDAGLQALTLPYAVLAGMTRDDRGDLRVFNASGEVVPHGFVPLPPAVAARVDAVLPLFPLTRLEAAGREPLPDLEIERDRQGQILRITQRPGPRPGQAALGYLIDNSQAELPLVGLEFDWASTAAGHLAEVTVEGSDDLEHWSPLALATLADMRFGGEQLLRRSIELPSTRKAYLRLTWRSPEPPTLSRVHGRYQDAPPERLDAQMLPLAKGPEPRSLRFDLPGPVVIERLALVIERPNALYQGQVYSRRDRHADWRLQAPLHQYLLNVDGVPLSSDPVPLPATRDREWLIRLDQPEVVEPDGLSVRIEWRPQRILFLASGPAPFQLAWGNPSIEPAPGISPILEDGSHLPAMEAVLGEIHALGGETRLQPPFRWQALLLWGVLLAGVALMGWMVTRLARQMGGR